MSEFSLLAICFFACYSLLAIIYFFYHLIRLIMIVWSTVWAGCTGLELLGDQFSELFPYRLLIPLLGNRTRPHRAITF
jgi:hypothetical protein